MLRVATLSDKQPFWEFDPNLFFYVLLPPIIFEAGYSLKRRLFLTNIGAILMFAVVGTAVSAGVVAGTLQIGGLLGWLDANLFGGVNTASGIHGSLLFASLISATDAVATLAILSSPEVNADPDLQATLFGESVLNDAVAIVLFQTLYDSPFSEARGGPGDASAILDVLGAFVKVSIGATAIGFALGLLLSLLLRHGTLYERSTHIEVSLTHGLCLSIVCSRRMVTAIRCISALLLRCDVRTIQLVQSIRCSRLTPHIQHAHYPTSRKRSYSYYLASPHVTTRMGWM